MRQYDNPEERIENSRQLQLGDDGYLYCSRCGAPLKASAYGRRGVSGYEWKCPDGSCSHKSQKGGQIWDEPNDRPTKDAVKPEDFQHPVWDNSGEWEDHRNQNI